MIDPKLADFNGTATQDDPIPSGQSSSGGIPAPSQPSALDSRAPAFTDDAPTQDDEIPLDQSWPDQSSAPDQPSADELSSRDDQPLAGDRLFGEDRHSAGDQPEALDPSVPRYADGTPLDARAPRFRDGMPLEVEMLQGSHPEHMAQFVSVAPGCYAVLVKGLGYARAGDGGLYAFDMRAYMGGIPPEPGSGIPFFGFGAELGVIAFKDAATGVHRDRSGVIHEGDAAANDIEDTLAALSLDQREIAEALIDNVADPSAAILQARERIYSEGENIPGADARPDLLQLAAHATRNERNISTAAMDMWITR